MEATWDKNGDIDRESFLGEVIDGKQKIVELCRNSRRLASALGATLTAGAGRRPLAEPGLAPCRPVQPLDSGLATGAIYALVAVGFSLLWQTSQTINFAQGEFVMVPAFFVLLAMNMGLPFPVAALIGIPSRRWCSAAVQADIVDPMLATACCRWRSPPSRSRCSCARRRRISIPPRRSPFPRSCRSGHLPSSARCSPLRAWGARRSRSRRGSRCTVPHAHCGRMMQATAQNPNVARSSASLSSG